MDEMRPKNEFTQESLDKLGEKLSVAKTEALSAIKEWSTDKDPIFIIESLLKSPAESKWLKENLGQLTYNQIEEMSDAEDSVQQKVDDLYRSRIATELKRVIDVIVAPLVLIKNTHELLSDDQMEKFGKWIETMLAHTNQDDVANIIEAAKRYDPNMVLESHAVYTAGEGQRGELHRTEQGSGPISAADVKLRLGKKGIIRIEADDDRRDVKATVYAYNEE